MSFIKIGDEKKIFFQRYLWRFSDFQSLDFLKNIKGSPLWKKKFFLSPILMKFKIWNPYGLGISHMKFERNRRQKFFWHRRVPPLDFSNITVSSAKIVFLEAKPMSKKALMGKVWQAINFLYQNFIQKKAFFCFRLIHVLHCAHWEIWRSIWLF